MVIKILKKTDHNNKMITIIKQYCHTNKSWQKVSFNECEGAFVIVFLQRKSVIKQILRIKTYLTSIKQC